MSTASAPRHSQGGALHNCRHLVRISRHHESVDLLLSPDRLLNATPDDLCLRTDVADSRDGAALLSRRHLPHLLHDTSCSHLRLLCSDRLPGNSSSVTRCRQQSVASSAPLSREGTRDARRSRHPLRAQLAADIRHTTAQVLRRRAGGYGAGLLHGGNGVDTCGAMARLGQ